MITEDIIKSYLWRDVIRRAFSPSSLSEQNSWMIQYCKSLKDFWQIDSYPPNPFNNNLISGRIPSERDLGISFDYCIFNTSKFNIKFLFDPNDTIGIMWTHDVDENYFSFPEQVFLAKANLGKEALKSKNITKNLMEAVVDGLICHPKSHQHIDHPVDSHTIRIGGGIDNPYLFLFHLRYQLCPFKEIRNQERERLVNLFFDAITQNSVVTISNLMKCPHNEVVS
ncbi:MAG: hypothetical protein KJ736_09485 [Candidatus Omnitrophica bacterium]|nr:hypothetical protein [Candidatus Omnitrophota bacterium]